jgi:hypothetical protein
VQPLAVAGGETGARVPPAHDPAHPTVRAPAIDVRDGVQPSMPSRAPWSTWSPLQWPTTRAGPNIASLPRPARSEPLRKPLDGGAQPGKRRAVPRDHAAAAENCESLYQVISRRLCALYFIEHCTLIARWMSDD